MYLISLDKKFDGKISIVQQEVKYNFEARVEALEKEVYNIFKLENKDVKENGPAEIRTQDPRRVKAMS